MKFKKILPNKLSYIKLSEFFLTHVILKAICFNPNLS